MADYTASYYGESVNAINWLSIVFLLCYLLFGLVAVWILDVLGLRTGVSTISKSWYINLLIKGVSFERNCGAASVGEYNRVI